MALTTYTGRRHDMRALSMVGKTLANLLLLLPYVAGWIAGAVIAIAIAIATAASLGWSDARKG